MTERSQNAPTSGWGRRDPGNGLRQRTIAWRLPHARYGRKPISDSDQKRIPPCPQCTVLGQSEIPKWLIRFRQTVVIARNEFLGRPAVSGPNIQTSPSRTWGPRRPAHIYGSGPSRLLTSGRRQSHHVEPRPVFFRVPEVILKLLVEPAFSAGVKGHRETDRHLRADTRTPVKNARQRLPA